MAKLGNFRLPSKLNEGIVERIMYICFVTCTTRAETHTFSASIQFVFLHFMHALRCDIHCTHSPVRVVRKSGSFVLFPLPNGIFYLKLITFDTWPDFHKAVEPACLCVMGSFACCVMGTRNGRKWWPLVCLTWKDIWLANPKWLFLENRMPATNSYFRLC